MHNVARSYNPFVDFVQSPHAETRTKKGDPIPDRPFWFSVAGAMGLAHAPISRKALLPASSRKRVFRLRDDRLERRFFVHRQIGHDFAVQLNNSAGR